ncbi:hypothetical protein Efla_000299 [Eimeria flavescens]
MWFCRSPPRGPLGQLLLLQLSGCVSGFRSLHRCREGCPPRSSLPYLWKAPPPVSYPPLQPHVTLLLRPFASSRTGAAGAAAYLQTHTRGRSKQRGPQQQQQQQQRGTLLRRHLRFFFLAIHPGAIWATSSSSHSSSSNCSSSISSIRPCSSLSYVCLSDLTQHFPREAKLQNANSLSQFNAYVDMLQQLLQQQHQQQQQQQAEKQQQDQRLTNKIPFVGQTLTFFLPQQQQATPPLDPLDFKQQQQQPEQQQQQQQQQHKVRPVYVKLHPLPLEIHRSQVEAIVESLFLRLSAAVEGRREFMDAAPNPAPLLTPKDKEKQTLDDLWQQQIDEVAFKDAIYQQNPKYLARVHAMRRCFRDYEKKLTQKALNTKNKKTRRRRLATVRRRAEAIVYRHFGPDPKTPPPDAEELLQKVEIAERGFHPELVYVHPSLTQQQRQESFFRLCGRLPPALPDSDRWLLSSLLSALRRNEPPIPLLVYKQYRHLKEAGMLEVPVELDVWAFADLVERELDNATRTRKQLLGCFSAEEQSSSR